MKETLTARRRAALQAVADGNRDIGIKEFMWLKRRGLLDIGERQYRFSVTPQGRAVLRRGKL